MTIATWLQDAIADAEQRGLRELKPMLETLAKAITAVRAADFNDNASPEATSDKPRGTSNEPRATSHER